VIDGTPQASLMHTAAIRAISDAVILLLRDPEEAVGSMMLPQTARHINDLSAGSVGNMGVHYALEKALTGKSLPAIMARMLGILGSSTGATMTLAGTEALALASMALHQLHAAVKLASVMTRATRPTTSLTFQDIVRLLFRDQVTNNARLCGWPAARNYKIALSIEMKTSEVQGTAFRVGRELLALCSVFGPEFIFGIENANMTVNLFRSTNVWGVGSSLYGIDMQAVKRFRKYLGKRFGSLMRLPEYKKFKDLFFVGDQSVSSELKCMIDEQIE
jgi:hypothetical protein